MITIYLRRRKKRKENKLLLEPVNCSLRILLRVGQAMRIIYYHQINRNH